MQKSIIIEKSISTILWGSSKDIIDKDITVNVGDLNNNKSILTFLSVLNLNYQFVLILFENYIV